MPSSLTLLTPWLRPLDMHLNIGLSEESMNGDQTCGIIFATPKRLESSISLGEVVLVPKTYWNSLMPAG